MRSILLREGQNSVVAHSRLGSELIQPIQLLQAINASCQCDLWRAWQGKYIAGQQQTCDGTRTPHRAVVMMQYGEDDTLGVEDAVLVDCSRDGVGIRLKIAPSWPATPSC